MKVPAFSAIETGLAHLVLAQCFSGQKTPNTLANQFGRKVWENLILAQEQLGYRIENALAGLRLDVSGEDQFVMLKQMLISEVETAKQMLAEMRLTEKQVSAIEATAHTLVQCDMGA